MGVIRLRVPQGLECCEENRSLGPEGDQQFTISRVPCVQKSNMYNIYMTPKRNETDAMPLSQSSGAHETESSENPETPEDPAGADGANPGECEMTRWMVSEELMIPRVPRSPLEPCARQIAEHELTGHAVCRSWCRHCVASKGRAHAHASRVEGELPEIGVDDGFFGRDREDVLSILCVKCRNRSA